MAFVKLQSEIILECEKCFTEIKEKYPDEIICGYALLADSDATSVSAVINSKRILKKVYTQAQQDDPEIDEACFKWSPSDWGDEIDTTEYFNNITEILYNESLKNSESIPFEEFRSSVHEVCVSALEALIKKEFFKNDIDDCVVVFTIPGSEDLDDEMKWIKRLNSKKLSAEYEVLVSTYLSD